MEISVKLFNQLRDYAPNGQTVFSLQLPGNSSVSELLEHLRIPSNLGLTILINGRRANEKVLFSPGDEVVLMSPIEGG